MIHSMTTRLALLYWACAFATLVVMAVALFIPLRKDINRDEAETLVHETDEVDDLLSDPVGNATLLRLAVDPDRDGNVFGKAIYMRVRDGRGDTLFETTGMPAQLPSTAFQSTSPDGRPWRHVTPDGHPYLITSTASGSTPPSITLPLVIEAAVDLTSDDRFVADFRDATMIVLLCGSVLFAVGAYAVTRQGLKPLAEIALAIKRTRAERLHDRLRPERWPSELAEVAREFDEMLLRLDDSFERLKHFSGDLAHELRTPVHAMMGQTEVALSKPRTSDEYQRLLESNLEEQTRLARLIDDLLFLARADNAQASVVRAPIDVGQALDTVIAYFDAIAQEKSIVLTREGHGTLHAERSLFRRAVSNLVSNALRHGRSGSSVSLIAEAGSDGSMCIRVIDDGTGIASEQLSRVFERFYRGDDAREQHDGGAGLGLAIVRSIMTLHGGTVAIASVPGRGTTATLHFPAGSA